MSGIWTTCPDCKKVLRGTTEKFYIDKNMKLRPREPIYCQCGRMLFNN